MEEDRLVKREIFAEAPLRVEYSLTNLGWKLRPLIDALADFGPTKRKQKSVKKSVELATDFFKFPLPRC